MMFNYLTYSIKVAVILAVSYMFFRLLLGRETFHKFNRAVLISIAILSFILPTVVITTHKFVEAAQIEEIEMPAEGPGNSTENDVNGSMLEFIRKLAPYIFTIVMAGSFIALSYIIFSIIRTYQIIRHGKCVQRFKLYGKEISVVTADLNISPFSWFNWIVISQQDYQDNRQNSCHLHEIIEHEKGHIAMRHSTDMMFVNILAILQWFNPAIWMLKRDLQEIHEYQADDYVLRQGADIKAYQYLLIKKAVGKSGYSITNSLNHSTLKNRITMMSKSNSNRMRALRVLYILPVIALSLTANAKTETELFPASAEPSSVAKVNQMADTLTKQNDGLIVIQYGQSASKANTSKPVPQTQDKPSVQNVSSEFLKAVMEKVQYPKEAIDGKLEGKVSVKYIVDVNGKLDPASVTVLKSCGYKSLDDAAVQAVKDAGKEYTWPQTMENGKPIPVNYVIPVMFKCR